jgi:hypothetical protein
MPKMARPIGNQANAANATRPRHERTILAGSNKLNRTTGQPARSPTGRSPAAGSEPTVTGLDRRGRLVGALPFADAEAALDAQDALDASGANRSAASACGTSATAGPGDRPSALVSARGPA